jgi:hypothetical protein
MRNWSWALISAALICALGTGAAWCAPPARVELATEIARNGSTIAEVSYVLEHDGRTYRLTEVAKGRGILALRGTTRRSSQGLVSSEGLRPLRFVDQRTGRSPARADFDWQANTVTLQYQGEPRTEALSPQAHDRLAFLFDFAFAPPRRTEAAFDLFDGRGKSRHVYARGGQKRLKTPLGELDALSFVRDKGTERTELWLAPGLSYLPLRLVVVEEDGTRYEQVTTKITPP